MEPIQQLLEIIPKFWLKQWIWRWELSCIIIIPFSIKYIRSRNWREKSRLLNTFQRKFQSKVTLEKNFEMRHLQWHASSPANFLLVWKQIGLTAPLQGWSNWSHKLSQNFVEAQAWRNVGLSDRFEKNPIWNRLSGTAIFATQESMTNFHSINI